MADIKKYWGLVAEQRAKLLSLAGVDVRGLDREALIHLAKQSSPAIWLNSIEDPMTGGVGGSTCAVSVENAARRLVERSHRLATKEEVAQFEVDQSTRERQCSEIEFRRKQERGGISVLLNREDAERVGAMPPAPPAGQRSQSRKDAA